MNPTPVAAPDRMPCAPFTAIMPMTAPATPISANVRSPAGEPQAECLAAGDRFLACAARNIGFDFAVCRYSLMRLARVERGSTVPGGGRAPVAPGFGGRWARAPLPRSVVVPRRRRGELDYG